MTNLLGWRKFLKRVGISYLEKGSRLQVLCPFHNDSQASSAVYESSGLFHCWVCGSTMGLETFQARVQGMDPLQLKQHSRANRIDRDSIATRAYEKLLLNLKEELRKTKSASEFWRKFTEFRDIEEFNVRD